MYVHGSTSLCLTVEPQSISSAWECTNNRCCIEHGVSHHHHHHHRCAQTLQQCVCSPAQTQVISGKKKRQSKQVCCKGFVCYYKTSVPTVAMVLGNHANTQTQQISKSESSPIMCIAQQQVNSYNKHRMQYIVCHYPLTPTRTCMYMYTCTCICNA